MNQPTTIANIKLTMPLPPEPPDPAREAALSQEVSIAMTRDEWEAVLETLTDPNDEFGEGVSWQNPNLPNAVNALKKQIGLLY